MSKINKLSVRGIRSFGTSKEDEQVSEIKGFPGVSTILEILHRKSFSLRP
jgi:hypothetical protein